MPLTAADKRERSLHRWGEVSVYPSLTNFETSFTGTNGVLSISSEQLPIDALFHQGKAPTLFVFFNAALKKGISVLPSFTWRRIAEACTGSRLVISDPTLLLSKDLDLAWYLGTENYPLQEPLARMIRAVMEQSRAKRVVFVGSSGGAFPALLYSQQFTNAAAFVNAPAITIRQHHNMRALKQFCRIAAPHLGLNGMRATLDIRDIVKGKLANPVIITQNKNDIAYINAHLIPFLADLGQRWTGNRTLADNLLVLPGDWGDGHAMPFRGFLKLILHRLSECPGDDFSKLELDKIQEPNNFSRRIEKAGRSLVGWLRSR